VGAEALAICEPIYEEFPGWKESTVGVKAFDKLPVNAQNYMKRLGAARGRPGRDHLDRAGSRGNDRHSAPFRLKRPK
jgi:adenylosuccinate synthase